MGLDANTKVLLHFNGADQSTTFIDESGKIWTPGGNAKIVTAQSVFGGASGSFDGSANTKIDSPQHNDFNMGADDWTYDFRIRFNAVGPSSGIFQLYPGGFANSFNIYLSTGWIYFKAYVGTTKKADYGYFWNPSKDTWYHVALVRIGTSMLLFIGGLSKTLTVTTAIGTTSLASPSGGPTIGYSTLSSFYLNGYLDEFRFSNTARWTSDFTPPIYAYPPPTTAPPTTVAPPTTLGPTTLGPTTSSSNNYVDSISLSAAAAIANTDRADLLGSSSFNAVGSFAPSDKADFLDSNSLSVVAGFTPLASLGALESIILNAVSSILNAEIGLFASISYLASARIRFRSSLSANESVTLSASAKCVIFDKVWNRKHIDSSPSIDWLTLIGDDVWPFDPQYLKSHYNEGNIISNRGEDPWDTIVSGVPITPQHRPWCGYWFKKRIDGVYTDCYTAMIGYTTISMQVGTQQQFTILNPSSVARYAWEISGPGSIDSESGLYTAPNTNPGCVSTVVALKCEGSVVDSLSLMVTTGTFVAGYYARCAKSSYYLGYCGDCYAQILKRNVTCNGVIGTIYSGCSHTQHAQECPYDNCTESWDGLCAAAEGDCIGIDCTVYGCSEGYHDTRTYAQMQQSCCPPQFM